jgi:hypothetical protein
MEFSLKGLKPFKIQTKFKIYFLPEIVIQNPFWFWSWGKKENCSPSSLLPSQKVTPCLNQGSYGFSDFKVDDFFHALWKSLENKTGGAATQRGFNTKQPAVHGLALMLPTCMHATVLPTCGA